MFLSDGHFTNVDVGDTVGSTDVSKLILDSAESGYQGLQFWQSPYQEWVYESGISMNNAPMISGLTVPYRASGVYINGTFFAQGPSAVSGITFYIDYINGRVAFAGTLPEDTVIQAQYTYRHFRTAIANKYTVPEIRYYTDHELKDNPWSNNNLSYPTGSDRIGPMPAVFIELGDGSSDVYEIGNLSKIKDQTIYFHVYAQSDLERDTAMDLLDTRWHMMLPMVDFNYAPLPLSGLVNTLSPVYMPLPDLQQNIQYEGQNVISKKFEFEEISTRGVSPLSNLERGIVEARMKIYNIAPTGRIEPNPFI
jgi:hypothetical protein